MDPKPPPTAGCPLILVFLMFFCYSSVLISPRTLLALAVGL